MIMTAGQSGSGGVLRLRNLVMIENIRRADDPAWRERLERQQVLARLGRMFGRTKDPLQALQDHADALREEWRRMPLHSCPSTSRDVPGG
jgi:hypothetical protein